MKLKTKLQKNLLITSATTGQKFVQGQEIKQVNQDGAFEGKIIKVDETVEGDEEVAVRLARAHYSSRESRESLPTLRIYADGIWKGSEDSLYDAVYFPDGPCWLQSEEGPFLLYEMGEVSGSFGKSQDIKLYLARVARYRLKYWSKIWKAHRSQIKLTCEGAAKLEQWLKGIVDIDLSGFCDPAGVRGLPKFSTCINAYELVCAYIFWDYNRIDPQHSILEDWATGTVEGFYSPLPTPRKETFKDFCNWLDENFLRFDDQLARQEERYKAQPTERNLLRLKRLRSEFTSDQN